MMFRAKLVYQIYIYIFFFFLEKRQRSSFNFDNVTGLTNRSVLSELQSIYSLL